VRDTPDADKRARLEVRDLDEAWETPVTSVAGVSVRPLLVIPACVGMCVRIFRVYVERIRDCTTLQTINRAFNNGVGFSSHNCCASHPCSRRWVGPRRQSAPRTPLAALRSFLNGSRLNGKVAHSKVVHVARGGVVKAAQLLRASSVANAQSSTSPGSGPCARYVSSSARPHRRLLPDVLHREPELGELWTVRNHPHYCLLAEHGMICFVLKQLETLLTRLVIAHALPIREWMRARRFTTHRQRE
jgi:hypothetical protein